ncbi:hypothetical protein QZH41_020022, partial [Actinostola sp. cb2023]
DDRVCPLVMVVKKWAKTHGINDSKDGTLSSYALTLMTIHYLQCRWMFTSCLAVFTKDVATQVPPPPPPPPQLISLKLRDLFKDDGNVNNLLNLDIQHLFQDKRIPRSQNLQSLGELLLGFFQYFANQFSWDMSVISVRLGRTYSTEYGAMKRKYIYIEEPFDSNNVAKTVYNFENFSKIKMKISLVRQRYHHHH